MTNQWNQIEDCHSIQSFTLAIDDEDNGVETYEASAMDGTTSCVGHRRKYFQRSSLQSRVNQKSLFVCVVREAARHARAISCNDNKFSEQHMAPTVEARKFVHHQFALFDDDSLWSLGSEQSNSIDSSKLKTKREIAFDEVSDISMDDDDWQDSSSFNQDFCIESLYSVESAGPPMSTMDASASRNSPSRVSSSLKDCQASPQIPQRKKSWNASRSVKVLTALSPLFPAVESEGPDYPIQAPQRTPSSNIDAKRPSMSRDTGAADCVDTPIRVPMRAHSAETESSFQLRPRLDESILHSPTQRTEIRRFMDALDRQTSRALNDATDVQPRRVSCPTVVFEEKQPTGILFPPKRESCPNLNSDMPFRLPQRLPSAESAKSHDMSQSKDRSEHVPEKRQSFTTLLGILLRSKPKKPPERKQSPPQVRMCLPPPPPPPPEWAFLSPADTSALSPRYPTQKRSINSKTQSNQRQHKLFQQKDNSTHTHITDGIDSVISCCSDSVIDYRSTTMMQSKGPLRTIRRRFSSANAMFSSISAIVKNWGFGSRKSVSPRV